MWNILFSMLLRYLLARLKEPSTWTALSVLGAFWGLPAGTFDAVSQIVGGVMALAGILMPERQHGAQDVPVADAVAKPVGGGGNG